jgi:hypothetical protein
MKKKPTSEISDTISCLWDGIRVDKLAKSRKCHFMSFSDEPESSNFKDFWMPDQAQHDVPRTFCEFIKGYQMSFSRETVSNRIKEPF